jgi:hypothetical protein
VARAARAAPSLARLKIQKYDSGTTWLPLAGGRRQSAAHLFVGPQNLQCLTRLQNVTMILHFLGGALGIFQALIEFAVAGFRHGLMQVAFGKTAGQILRG